MKLVLEPRYLFDGSVHAVTKHAANLAGHDTPHHDGANHPASHSDAAVAPAVAATPALSASQPDIPALAPNPAADQILFVDTRVADWQTLAAGVSKDVQVILIDPNKDGIQQVTDALQGRHNLESIQFLTYGQSGEIELGSSAVTAASLSSHAAEVASWGDHLAADADIQFYGCDVGQGSAGLAFVDTVHTLTGAEVGASTDATGDAALGGNWTLERTTGALAAGLPFSEAALADYHHVLDINPVPTVTFSNTPTSILLGSSFTETVSFTNTAATAVGYGPFIDVFVPNDAAQKATLTSATFLGQAVTTDTVTLSTSVAGHSGVLGALHPFAVDSSGNPLFVAAPTGYQAGDTMYVLQLPFGSYTPGEPAAAINLTFSTDTKTELSSVHSGQPLNISAIGGFQFGKDPLNDPATDPSIRGTTLTPGATSASDGLVVAPSQIVLIETSTSTDLHESETATGPDYPFNYVLNITPAPVTQGDPIQSLDFTFDLPSQVQYTNGTIAITGPGGSTGTATFHAGTGGANTPGGTVTIHFTSLTTDGSDTATQVMIPVFVPRNDASGHAILDPTTGAPMTISASPIYSYSGTWDATAASLDHNGGVATGFSGDSNSAGSTDNSAFVAKSLAIQLSDDAGGSILPGQVVTDTIHFEVSDYFSLNNLTIANLLTDGATLLVPGDAGYVAPVLSITRTGTTTGGISFGDAASSGSDVTVNGQAVSASGSDANWNYSRDDAGATSNPGATSISFEIGTLLQSHFGGTLGSVLQGGTGSTQGTVTFVTRVLDKYTNINSGDSIREQDGISDTVTTTGTAAAVVTVAGGVATPTGGMVTDGSSVSDAVAQGNLVLTVVAVNGSSADTTDIHPGDTVTYALTYNLTSGDYGDFNLEAFLPLPVFEAADPHANGGSVASYTADNTDPFPLVGQYKLVNPGTGMTVVGNSTSATANSIDFNLGDRDDPTNASGQKAIIYFSVIASTAPFADALQLTAQAQSLYTNASGSTAAASSVRPVLLNEPELKVKTGIVSLVKDDGTTGKGTYSVDPSGTGQTTSPLPSGASGSPFQPAGTATGTDPFTGSGAPLSSDDLNVTGADAGDTARVVSTVTNSGHATAYGVVVSGTLPTGYTTTDVHNFGIYNAAGTRIDTGVTAAQYFSAGGVTLPDAGGIAGQASIYVVYDLKLQSTQTTGNTLTPSSAIVNWTNIPTGGTNFVTGGTPIGESASALSDTASIGTTAPAIAKTVLSASDTTDVPLTGSDHVVLGETVTYQLTLTLPEGVTSNGGSDVTLTDVLPSGLTLTSLDSITFNGVTHTGGTVSSTGAVSGSTLTIHLGQSLSNTQADVSGTVTITYTVTVVNTTPSDGATHTNNVTLQYGGTGTVPPASATVTEVDPHVAETITVKDTGTGLAPTGGVVFSNEGLTYTVTLTNNGDAKAENLIDLISIPTGLTYSGGLAVGTGTGVNAAVDATDPTHLKVTMDSLAVGASQTFTFTATVDPNQAAGTSLPVQTPNDTTSGTYYSLPGTAQGHKYNDNASVTLQTGQIVPVLSIVGESNNTTPNPNTPAQTNTQTTAQAVVGEVVRMHAYVQIPEGANPTTLDFTLPTGLQFLNDGSATIAFVSPNGDLSSSVAGLAGVTQLQDSNSGGAMYVNPITGTTTAGDVATTAPTFAIPGGVIDTSMSGHVKLGLGTLTNNDTSPIGNYVLVEFNAVVQNVATNTQGATLTTSYAVGSATSNSTTLTVEEPHLTITKTPTAINSTTGTVTYQIVVHNTGPVAADNIVIDDPTVTNEQNLSFVSDTAGGNHSGTTGSDLHVVVTSLAAGGTETITYTVQVASQTAPVTGDAATATYQSLPGSSTFHGSTAGSGDGTTGLRDFNSGSNPPNNYDATVTTELGTASGRVWQDLGDDDTTFSTTGGSRDTSLGGITVTATVDGFTETTTTASDGTYNFGLLPDGTVTITLPGSGSGGLPSNETLVFNPDGSTSSNPASASVTAAGNTNSGVNFVYQLPDTAPSITSWGGNTVGYTEGGSPVTLSGPGATITDSEINTLGGNYGGTTLTVERYNSAGTTAAPNSTDLFSGTGLLSLSGSTVTYNGSTVGTFTQTGGVLAITFANGTTSATVGNVLDAIGFSSTSTNTIAPGGMIGAKIDDHNVLNGHGSFVQGTGGDMTSPQVLVTLNENPAPLSESFTEPNDSSASAAKTLLDSTVALIGIPSTVTVSFTAGSTNAEDVLSFTASGSTGNIAATGGTNGTSLTLTSSGGTATSAQWQAALQAIGYYDSSDTPSTTSRSISLAVTTAGQTVTIPVTMSVTAANDSPILNTGVSVSLTSSTEDVLGAPTNGTVGTLVSSLVGTALNVTDPDGAGVANGGTVAPAPGIAITAIDTTYGNWYYSTDGGATWTMATGISTSHALRLDANAEIYFQPTQANLNGTISNAITFHAWDQFGGGASGSFVDLTSVGTLGSGTNTAGSAYSSLTDSLPVHITAVNDAPVASGTATLTGAQTVATLFAANFDDSADTQTTLTGGSTANSFAGIAITGDAADPVTQGVYQYSTNGTTWTTITASSVSATGALVLSNMATLRFDPVVGFSGTPGALTVHVIDTSTGNVSTTGVTGAALAGSSSVFTGIDIASHDGTPTPISSGTAPLSTTVTVATPTVTYTEPNDSAASGNAVTLDSSITLPTATYTAATIAVTGGGHTSEDLLTFTSSGSTGNIAAVGGSGGTPLTLSSSGNTATTAQWQAALDSIKFYDSSDTPFNADRTVTISAVDSTGENTTAAIVTVHVTPANDSPILTPNASLTIANATQDSLGAPVGAVGTLVSSLVTGNVTDTDDANVANGGSVPANVLGIAVSQADTTEGNWYYSTDNGSHWTEFASSGMTAISNANALHLLADGTTRIYFQPTIPGANGVIATALTYHAWDQFDSAANGSLSALPSGLGTGVNTAGSAYSSAVQILPMTITAVGGNSFIDPNDTTAIGAAVVVDNAAVLTATADTFTSATVTITNFQPEDHLVFTPNGSTGSVALGSFSGGVLTLTAGGGATAAQFQAALRAVTYYDSSDTPIATARNITLTAHDSTAGSDVAVATGTVNVIAANDSPILNDLTVSLTNATENAGVPTGAVGTLISALTGGGNVTDTDGANVHDGGTAGLLGVAITQADTTEGTWYYTTDGGTTWTAFASAGMTAISPTNALHLIANANTRIYFQPTVANANGQIDQALTFRGWDQFDGAANGSLSALPTDSAFGAGINTAASAYSAATEILPLHIDTVGGAAFTDPNDTPASGAGVPADALAVLSSTDTFSSATIQITGNYQIGQDTLIASAPGFSSVFDVSTGTLTLTKAGATAAEIQAALRTVQYYDSSDTPNTSPRTLTITVADTTTSTTRTLATPTLTVTAANDSPILNDLSVSLVTSTEDDTSPHGAVGTLVSALTGGGNVTDTDNANVSNSGILAGNALGVAITAADTTEGAWYYTTDGGTTWTPFAGSGMTAISATNALHLAADSNTRIYFQPTANWNGEINNGLTFRGWDKFDGSANGSLSALPTDSAFGAGVNTNASAYSAATQTLPLFAIAVNDAPIANGSATLTTPEDTTNPPGDTVAHLFGGAFNDSTDQQITVGNPTGSVANTLAGIAITGNAATAGQGVYQYSTDNGAHWTDIPTTGLGDTGAIILPVAADIRFVPVANFNGVPGSLTTRLIDSSTTIVTGSTTGFDLSTGTTAFTGVDVSANGGITAISAATVPLTTSVTPVNDAPVAGGTATLTTPEDTANPPGVTVTSVLGQNTITYTDATDTVTTAVSGGSIGTPPAAIAVTGNTATPDQGVYQYSTDGGVHWITIPATGLGATNAIVIPVTADIRFVPVANFNGVPGQLTAHVSDGTALPPTGPEDISAAIGGTGGFSTGTIVIGTTVVPVNDAPIASGTASLTPTNEDTANPPGDTVGHLFGSHFNDTTDQQQTSGNPTGSVANTLAGIAITGNAATPDQGVYQYSTDGGTTWVTIPVTGLSDGNSIVLPVSADIRFLPTANFNGIPGDLTTRLIDSSTTVVTGTVTGLDLSTGTTAFTGVDVSGANHGGTTAVSATPVDLTTSVTAVNDAPIATGSVSLTPTSEDTLNPPGDTITNLFGSHFNDNTDLQKTATNPTGSVPDTLAGIAVTGNAATGAQGVYQYSTDNGATWSSIPATGLGDNSAIILPATAELRFLPAIGFNGTPGALTTRLIDTSSGALAGAETGVNLTAVGGITPYSADNVVLTTNVIEVATVPIRTTATQTLVFSFDTDTDLDKQTQSSAGGGEGRAFTDDFLARPIIPQVSLIGSVGNKFVIAEQHSVIAVPSNLFEDSYPGAQLEFDARSPSGGALPGWLQFDARNLTFSGTPPASQHGAVDVTIVARDQFGNEATASFRILVGRDDEALQSLMGPPKKSPAEPTPIAAPGSPDNGNDNAQRHRGQKSTARETHLADASGTVDGLFASLTGRHTNNHNLGRSAFSAQLRDAGAMGRLSQARHLLEAIAKADMVKPAA